MRITERSLRSVIKKMINEMSDDALGHSERPEAYAGMGGAPSSDLNHPVLISLKTVMKEMNDRDPIRYATVFKRMCDAIVDCDPRLEMYCSELLRQINEGFTLNDKGIRECLYYICQNHECCEIVLQCCAGVTVWN